MTCRELLERHADKWDETLESTFLDDCMSGRMTQERFDLWLIQYYHFVVTFTRMVAQVLASAPSAYFKTLLAGLMGLQKELRWLNDESRERGIPLQDKAHPLCWKYAEFLSSLASEAFSVQFIAYWIIEHANSQAWQKYSPMPPPYESYAERWINPDFSDYIELLEQEADDALSSASDRQKEQAETVFLSVLDLERRIWLMAGELRTEE